MSSCPFCNAPIDDVAARFGGRCPSCFIEIPGEEAQTNPGAKHTEGDGSAKKNRRRRRIFTFTAGAFLAVGGISLYVVRGHESAQGASILDDADFGSFYMVPLRDIKATASDPNGPGPSTAGNVARRGASYMARHAGNEPTGSQNQLGASEDGASQGNGGQEYVVSENAAPGSGSPQGNPDESDVAASAKGSDTPAITSEPALRSDGSLNIRARETEVLHEDQTDTEVKAQVWDLVKEYSRQIQACYERRLKLDNALKGAWLVTLEVGKDGRPSKVWAKGQSMQDRDLEQCMMTRALSWRFPPMAEPMTFEVPYRLGL
jgi:hypothetical protein